jgi:hypothetical protein
VLLRSAIIFKLDTLLRSAALLDVEPSLDISFTARLEVLF